MENAGCLLLLLSAVSSVHAAEPGWQPVAADLLKREKTGFGGLCGVLVDHKTGALWVNLSDRGMFHSPDQGKTWKRVSESQPRGRTETPGCWLLDPTGKSDRMVTALVYGSPIALSVDRAAGWKYLDNKSAHIDWCAIDWTDPKTRFILALKHESGGLLLASRDGGQSFSEIGKGYGPGWVFDGRTAVVAAVKTRQRPNAVLLRTTDGGVSFAPCGDFSPVGSNSAQTLPKWHGDKLWWLTEGGLIASSDKGRTWKKLGVPKNAQYGPVFGKDAQHMFVLTRAGAVESTNGGASWSAPLPPPPAMKGLGGLSWLEYDPINDVIYLMKMGSDLYRLERRAGAAKAAPAVSNPN